MKRTLCLTLALAFVSTAVAQEETKKPEGDSEALTILKKVDEATKAVKSIRCKGTIEGKGAAASRTPTAEGTILVGPSVDGAPGSFRMEVTIKLPGSDESQKITVGSDGENFFLIDYKDKIVYEDIDRMVLGSLGGPAQRIFMNEFTHATPFSDEINGDEQELRGSESVGGVDCHKIYIKYTGGGGEAIWYFGKKDFLPRRVDRLRTSSGGAKGKTVQTVLNLEVDPKIPADAFKVTVPEGFTKSDDFAP